MCGILGIIHRQAALRSDLSSQALMRLAHRGPDGSGVFTDSHAQLGHVRLSILDLTDAGHQPMSDAAGRYVVTFNGEIYNYLELKAELQALGYVFSGRSDTEVLLAAYRAWDTHCVERFLGMFAFVIWDSHEKTIFMARDRCGEKPLFYHNDSERLTFASELKALLPLLHERPKLNVSSVDQYLHYQYVPEPNTLLQEVHKLPAGYWARLSLADWKFESRRYWSVESSDRYVQELDLTGDPLLAIRRRLDDAVNLTLRSDVPVGIALSGGVDSGAIAVIAQKNYPEPMHAFCVGYPGRPPYDERHQARALAESLGMIVHEVELPVNQFVDFFPELVRIMDEPIADPAAFGHYSVPKAAADQGIKVLLSGIGGDEVFWGYQWVKKSIELTELTAAKPSIKYLQRWAGSRLAQEFLFKVASSPHAHANLRKWAEILWKLANPNNSDDQPIFYMLALDFADAFDVKGLVYGPAMRGLTKKDVYAPTDIGARSLAQVPAAVIQMLFDTWLVSNCLSLGDRVSMGVGVETRMPFLDARLIELVMALRLKTPDHHLGQKAWLREALKGVVPDEVLKRPKAGFQPPVREWISGVVTRHIDILRSGQLVSEGVLDANKINFLCKSFHEQGWTQKYFTYKLILLEMWYQKVVMG
jgi:asparagine synthase (glutamine-hydrolysing)